MRHPHRNTLGALVPLALAAGLVHAAGAGPRDAVGTTASSATTLTVAKDGTGQEVADWLGDWTPAAS